jgi:hypothetical protein
MADPRTQAEVIKMPKRTHIDFFVAMEFPPVAPVKPAWCSE